MLLFCLAGALFNNFVHLQLVPTRTFEGNCNYLLSVLARSTHCSPWCSQHCGCSFACSTEADFASAEGLSLTNQYPKPWPRNGTSLGHLPACCLVDCKHAPGKEGLIATFWRRSFLEQFHIASRNCPLFSAPLPQMLLFGWPAWKEALSENTLGTFFALFSLRSCSCHTQDASHVAGVSHLHVFVVFPSFPGQWLERAYYLGKVRRILAPCRETPTPTRFPSASDKSFSPTPPFPPAPHSGTARARAERAGLRRALPPGKPAGGGGGAGSTACSPRQDPHASSPHGFQLRGGGGHGGRQPHG